VHLDADISDRVGIERRNGPRHGVAGRLIGHAPSEPRHTIGGHLRRSMPTRRDIRIRCTLAEVVRLATDRDDLAMNSGEQELAPSRLAREDAVISRRI